MNPGMDLITAIKANNKLGATKDCPAVSVNMSLALYGSVQDDGTETSIEANSSRHDLMMLLWCNGKQTETAVWHFQTVGTVHHFVIVPWYNQSLPGWTYTVFMAYENKYSLREYIQNAPVRGSGHRLSRPYRDEWSSPEIVDMLLAVLTGEDAWKDYFSDTSHKPTSINCYKYKNIAINDASVRLNLY